MGAWGAGLFQNDTAADIRDYFREVAKAPVSDQQVLDKLLEQFPAADPQDEDYTVTWLALADLFHEHGMEVPSLCERALAIIESGADDAMSEALEMSVRDRTKRAALLAGLAEKWRQPNPAPKRRAMASKAQKHAVSVGDIWALPTQDGNPPNTYFPASHLQETFKPDGWTAIAFISNAHYMEYKAASFFLRLHVDGPQRPTLATCLDASVSGAQHYLQQESGKPPEIVAGWAEVTPAILKKLRAELLGNLNFDMRKVVDAVYDPAPLIERRGPGSLCGQLHIWQRWIGTSGDFMTRAEPLPLKLRDMLA